MKSGIPVELDKGGYDNAAIASVFFEAAAELEYEVCFISEDYGVGEIRCGARSLLVHGRWLGINDLTSTMLCSDKHYSTSCLRNAGLPVPEAVIAQSSAQTGRSAAARVIVDTARDRYPVCIKPVSGSHGFQVVPDIRNEDEMLWVLYTDSALGWSDTLIESQQEGRHYRVVVAFGEVIGCVERRAPTVKGDGNRTLELLIDDYNHARRRENLNIVSFGPRQSYVVNRRHHLGLSSTVPDGTNVVLDDRCNLKVGGTIHYVAPELVPSRAAEICIEAASLFDLEFAGLDLIGDDIREHSGNWVINEVNSQPAAHVPVSTMSRKHRLDWPVRLLKKYFEESVYNRHVMKCSLGVSTGTSESGDYGMN